MGDAPGTVEVGVEHAAPVTFVHFQEGHRIANPGVVDQNVAHAEGVLGGTEAGVDAVGVGYVHGDRHCLKALLLELVHQRGQAIGAAGSQHDTGAGSGQYAGEVGAEAAGGAGNQGSFAGQVEARGGHWSDLLLLLGILNAPEYRPTYPLIPAQAARVMTHDQPDTGVPSGKLACTSRPPSGLSPSNRLPWWRSMMRCTMDRPSPAPWLLP